MAKRNDATRKRARRIIAARREACHICGREIDFTLKSPDPMSFEVDHVVPLHKGGADALPNMRAAHRLPGLQLEEARSRLRTHRA